jgi:biotin operon repressor
MESKANELFTENGLSEMGVKPTDSINVLKVGAKVKVKNEFVMMFVENFERLIPILTKTELRVMICVLKYLNYQNVFQLSQKAICADTGISKPNVSKALKTLRDRKILAENENGVGYINPFIFAKGAVLEVKSKLPQMELIFDGGLESSEIKKPF